MGTKKKLGWDKKFDMIVGPGKKLQTLMARSIIGKLKTPFWIGFDKKMTKIRRLSLRKCWSIIRDFLDFELFKPCRERYVRRSATLEIF